MRHLKSYTFLALFFTVLLMSGTASADYAYLSGWGQVDSPRGVALDRAGNVYVVDQASNRTQVFSEKGEFLREWGCYGSGEGQFFMPFGIAIAGSRVFIADSRNNRVQVFAQNGSSLACIDTLPVVPERPFQPVSVATDSSGRLFIGGTGGIQVYSPDLEKIATYGSFGTGNDQFQVLFGLAVNSTGYIYAADTLACRVQVISPDGTFVGRFGERGDGPGEFFFPTGLAIAADDRVFVADSNNDRVQVLDPAGRPLAVWGGYGPGPGQYGFVTGVAVKNQENARRMKPELIYTTDLENDRVQVHVAEVVPGVRAVAPTSARSGAQRQLIKISGEGFLQGCTVRLEREGEPPIPLLIRGVPFSDRIVCTANLVGNSPGKWDVVIENPGGVEGRLPGAFSLR